MATPRKRGRPRQEIRIIDGVEYKWCAHHKAWERLATFDRSHANGAYEASCQVARMANRDSDPGESFIGTGTCIDPDLHALALKFVEVRASEVVKRVRYVGETIDRRFVMEELNYDSLVAPIRAFIGPDGICTWCGLPFTKKHRLSLDHVEPPRWDGTVDWERLHAQNVQVMHFGENGSKGEKPFANALHDNMQRWMAERRWARHAGEKGWPSLKGMRLPPPEPEPEPEPEQDLCMTIFDFLEEGSA